MATYIKPLCYIAGPYTHPDPVENTHDASQLTIRMIDDGYVTPICPHATLILQLVSPHSDVDYWYAYDNEVLAHCDAVFRMPGESKGANDECRFAGRLGKPVFYSLEALYEWADQHTTWQGLRDYARQL
jgi:hypothetical protein